jgi:hypothetical protein
LSYGDGVAFWALAEMVRQRFDIAEEDLSPVAAEKLHTGLQRWIADPAARAYVGPRLGQLLGVDVGEAGVVLGREELFAGWRLFFERLAAQAPVVMVVEDLQHADAGLLDFLEHLLDWAKGVPIFVLTLARPELESRRAGWGSGRRNSTALTLDPLDDAAMGVLLDGLVPGMPDTAKTVVAGRAEGIPLYAVKPFGCSSTATSSSPSTGSIDSSATSASSVSQQRCSRCWPRGWTRSTPAARALWQTQRSLGAPSLPKLWSPSRPIRAAST